jgi:hypothetical protein
VNTLPGVAFRHKHHRWQSISWKVKPTAPHHIDAAASPVIIYQLPDFGLALHPSPGGIQAAENNNQERDLLWASYKD